MKYKCFLKNAELLHEKFGIIPLLYGSLGLEVLLKADLASDDIDILIPGEFIAGERWGEFRLFLEASGYKMIDEHKHTFVREEVEYSYAAIEGLKDFAGIDISDIPSRTDGGVQFMLLSLEQYLKVYLMSSLDGYRMNVKEKQDNQKIELIKKYMN